MLKSVLTLLGGVWFSQFIIAGSMLALTRLYTPEDFEALAVFVAIVAIIATPACLRFDVAIAIPASESRSKLLLILALCIATLVALILVAILAILPSEALRLAKMDPGTSRWAIPLGVWLLSSFSAIQFWLVKNKEFAAIARARVGQSLLGACLQILAGVLSVGTKGLILGQILINGSSAIILVARLIKRNQRLHYRRLALKLRFIFGKYRAFPLLSVLESTLNVAAIQLPLLLIGALASESKAAQIFLAMRVMQIPMSLMGSSVAQVYLSEAPSALLRGELGFLTAKVVGALFRIGLPPLVMIGALAPYLFPLVFGQQWTAAGHIVLWMTPWFALQFLSSPISLILQVTGRQREGVILQALGFTTRVGMVTWALFFQEAYVAEFYAVSGLIFYSIYLTLLLRVSGTSARGLLSGLKLK